MIIIGKENCPKSKELNQRYPHIKYIELPCESCDTKILKIKSRLFHLNAELPCIVNDGISKLLSEDFLL